MSTHLCYAANSRTAEANALAAYRSADYAASAEGVATIETAIDIPWTQYQTDLAAAKAAWWEIQGRPCREKPFGVRVLSDMKSHCHSVAA